METKLTYPFDVAFEHGHSIDYVCHHGEDHHYAKKLGYETEMHSDCSYSAKGLRGLSFTSYGDWGTLYTDSASEESKKMFLDMYNGGLIKLWRIRAYIHDKEGNCITYDYEEGKGWITYNGEQWINCEDPFPKYYLMDSSSLSLF